MDGGVRREPLLTLLKAFESPLLAEFNSNSSGRDLARATTASSVRYGARSAREYDGQKLAFGQYESVRTPLKGTAFDS
jgi:hypothetical protein